MSLITNNKRLDNTFVKYHSYFLENRIVIEDIFKIFVIERYYLIRQL